MEGVYILHGIYVNYLNLCTDFVLNYWGWENDVLVLYN
jgi:hypothetical protein